MPSPPESFEIRPGTDDDIPAIVELMRVSLGEGKIPRTREFWHWKHRRNPFGASYLRVATAQGGLVGVRLFMRWTFEAGSFVAHAVRAVDTATHPDWQGRGIFKRLTLDLVNEVAQSGAHFIFNTPNDSSRPGYLKMGWQQVGRIGLWVKPRLPLHALSRFIRQDTSDDWTSDPEPSDRERSHSVLAAAADAGLLAVRATNAAQYATPVSREYLTWRYLECPAARYQLSSIDPGQALVVHRQRNRHGLRELTITDVVFRPTLKGMRAAVASLSAVVAKARPDYAVAALHRSAAEALALTSCGFVPVPRLGPILTVRDLGTPIPGPSPFSLAGFRASIGDLELF